MIKHFTEYLNELNRSDIKKIRSNEISSSFTISFEIELETKDTSGSDKEYTEYQISDIMKMINSRINSQFLKFNNIDNNKIKHYKDFIKNLLSEIEHNLHTDDEYIEEILDLEKYKDPIEYGIVQLVCPLIDTYFYHDNIFYLKNKLVSYLPSFWEKWGQEMKYEVDNTLERGIEISMKKYIIGIDNAIKFINDFYTDFNNQEYWKFKSTTGIHINIGINYEAEWNIIKGLLILNDTVNNPYLFKGIEWRKDTMFTKSIKKEINALSKKEKDKILSNIDLHKIKSVEKYFNEYLYKKVKELGFKNFGFNITSIPTDKYVEFRYPGGNISKPILIEKLLYFCFIVYCMTNPDYKKNEYQKKIYKFFNNL